MNWLKFEVLNMVHLKKAKVTLTHILAYLKEESKNLNHWSQAQTN